MTEFITTHIKQFRVFAGTKDEARSVKGMILSEQIVVNEVNLTRKPQWPIWAKALKQLATPDDKGIGDVVARLIGAETSEKFKAWHLATFGRPCNCTSRQERWNRQYPLNL